MSAAARSSGQRFSPQGFWAQVPPQAVQGELRRAFAAWGLPEQLRIDNGHPWGSKGDLPTDLALWLLGLDVQLIWNPPRRPQDNGVVERSQGTGKRWGEPHTCASLPELQARFDEQDELQRACYPYADRQSRLATFPSLAHSGRRYSPSWETRHWSLERVREHLAGYTLARRVDQKGQVSLYNRNYYLGVIHREKTVYVMFDAQAGAWVFASEQGQEIRRVAAEEIERERIETLQVTHRRERGQSRPLKPSGACQGRQN